LPDSFAARLPSERLQLFQSGNGLFQFLHHVAERCPNRKTPFPKLYDVEPSLSSLAFTNARLRQLQPFGQLDLRDSSGLPSHTNCFEEKTVLLCIDGLLHGEIKLSE